MKSSVGLYYQLTVTDKKTGKVIRKTRLRRSKSWVIAFLQTVEVQMMQVGVNIRDVLNTVNAINPNQLNLDVTSGVGDDTEGIIVGTGTTAPDNMDYVIETIIAHGAGAGQLNYGAMSKTTSAEVGANVDFLLTRTFTNASGGTINVTEIAVYSLSGAKTNMIIHDTCVAVPVNNGQVLTVTYTLRTTV